MTESAPVVNPEPIAPTPDNYVDPVGAPAAELEASLNEIPAPKTYVVKVDGQEMTVTEDELLKGFQTTTAAQKRFSEAAALRKQAESFLQLAKTDPRKLLSHPEIGVDMEKLLQEYLAEQMEENVLSPEEKELREYKRRVEEFEKAREEAENATRQAEIDRYTAQYEQELTAGFTEALEQSGLPKTESTIQSMAQYMLRAAEAGYQVQPKDVAEFVKADYLRQVKSLFGAANEDILLQLLGDEITGKVVKGHLKKVKSKQPQVEIIKEVTQPTNIRPQPQKKLSRDEWLAEIRDRASK